MNISELARHLGVSVSTVSRVLSGNAEKYRISDKTVRRIQKAAEENHVSPDPLGAGLRRGRLAMVGLLVPDITNSFFAQLARAIESEFRPHGIAVQLCDSAEDSKTELELLGKLLSRRLDGLILAPVGKSSPKLSRTIAGSRMPIILIDRLLPGVDAVAVSLDNEHAGHLAATRLLESGHQRIGCLRGDPESPTDEARFMGVRKALLEAGFAEDRLLSAGRGYSHAESLVGAEELLLHETKLTALITLSGQGALAALEVARRLSIRVPEDLSLVAFDEQPWSNLMQPPITTVAQPVDAMARRAVELLENSRESEKEGKNKTEPQLFAASVMDRESVSELS
ncbi:MAG: LacI family DNA-binding transcriptional regulator [Verrucomicrobiota bacterium]